MPRDRSTIRAIKLTAPLRVDGRLDEEVYTRERSFGSFLQVVPHYGEEQTERTEVWVMYDDRNIYVACKCWDSAASRQVDCQRTAARYQSASAERSDRRDVRYLLRSPQRLPLLHQSARRARRLFSRRRRRLQHRLESGVVVENRAIRRRLDGRNGDSVQVAALPRRRRIRSGASKCGGRCVARTNGRT